MVNSPANSFRAVYQPTMPNIKFKVKTNTTREKNVPNSTQIAKVAFVAIQAFSSCPFRVYEKASTCPTIHGIPKIRKTDDGNEWNGL